MSKFARIADCFARAVGHTHAACEVAKKVNGYLVVANHAQKRHIPPDVKTISLDSFPESFMGLHAPLIIDNFAVTHLALDYDRALAAKDKEIEQLRAELARKNFSSRPPNGHDYVEGVHQEYCCLCKVESLEAELAEAKREWVNATSASGRNFADKLWYEAQVKALQQQVEEARKVISTVHECYFETNRIPPKMMQQMFTWLSNTAKESGPALSEPGGE